ncbi:extracellular matrix protein precursor [Moelleriella libera RCEF 2490]|uniref:Extracellular matrix protein n=1 Tax=Moelleriella libera RCEF 2490 TaxID=1081109 RepID=A0A166UUS7_9HYPO|nr:extracellular matrix protein precursor [Moelleriella libera RCEF 2490]
MKYAAVVSTLAAVGMAAQPHFLNTDFQVSEGKAFTLKFDNCQGGCTITLQNGPSTNTKNVKTLTSSATGGSFTFTPSDLPSGSYNFKITDNGNPSENNFSVPFTYQGTGSISASASASASSASSASASSASASSASASSASASSTASGSSSTSAASTTSASASSSTSGASTTATPTSSTYPPPATRATSTRTSASATTTVPNAAGRPTPLALVAGAIAAIAYLG